MNNHGLLRTRWAAVGAAVAVSLGAGGIGLIEATTSSGERPIYRPIEPCRLSDTRPDFQVGTRGTPLNPAETYTLAGSGEVGQCDLPSDTAGLSLNVTALDASQPTFLTLFPAGADLPNASSLNPLPGQPPTPNAVNVDLSAGGEFSVYNFQGTVHIIVDVVGIFDDHNHDDRYYTKEQVDTAIGAIPAGPEGPAGADGAQGPQGDPGPQGLAAWDTIPSGVTVTGGFVYDETLVADNGDHYEFVQFPAKAPSTPTAVNFAADSDADTIDDDAACTGSTNDPTAPAGRVCVYLSGNNGSDGIQAFDATGAGIPGTFGFQISWRENGALGGDMYVYATWAYTAP